MANNTGLQLGDRVSDGMTKGVIVGAQWDIDYLIVRIELMGQLTPWTTYGPAEDWHRIP